MLISYYVCCPNCGERLTGDGFTQVQHCPNADKDELDYMAPDEGPVFCNS